MAVNDTNEFFYDIIGEESVDFHCPEMLNFINETYTTGYQDTNYYSWAIGVLIFTLLTGTLPFYDQDKYITRERIKAADFKWPEKVKISGEAVSLIDSIFTLQVLRRLSLEEIEKHPFFEKWSELPSCLPPTVFSRKPHKKYIAKYLRLDMYVQNKETELPLDVRIKSHSLPKLINVGNQDPAIIEYFAKNQVKLAVRSMMQQGKSSKTLPPRHSKKTEDLAKTNLIILRRASNAAPMLGQNKS